MHWPVQHCHQSIRGSFVASISLPREKHFQIMSYRGGNSTSTMCVYANETNWDTRLDPSGVGRQAGGTYLQPFLPCMGRSLLRVIAKTGRSSISQVSHRQQFPTRTAGKSLLRFRCRRKELLPPCAFPAHVHILADSRPVLFPHLLAEGGYGWTAGNSFLQERKNDTSDPLQSP